MNPETPTAGIDKMRSEYDFSQGKRGVHHAAYEAGTNVVFLEPDLVDAFPDSASVNQALRLLVRLSRSKAVTPRRTVKGARRRGPKKTGRK
ncbi:MAG TPA: hypothetical protein VM791_10380 [Vicinamibacterales bacterium]|jgi:hypothetical protein|nr:hypothetical protein [Vicinamibacterales bacterium]